MTSTTSAAEPPSRGSIDRRLFETRRLSLELAEPLSAEDMTVQAMDDASPTKWHLAHVTWFFETFILSKHLPGYQTYDESFNYCFNSYYESQGARQPRPKRGLLTRPSSERVFAYRAHVDEALAKLLARGIAPTSRIARLVEVGINHEQQHQELLLTDILALFAASPLRPAYRAAPSPISSAAPEPMRFIEFAGGVARHVCQRLHHLGALVGGQLFQRDALRCQHRPQPLFGVGVHIVNVAVDVQLAVLNDNRFVTQFDQDRLLERDEFRLSALPPVLFDLIVGDFYSAQFRQPLGKVDDLRVS